MAKRGRPVMFKGNLKSHIIALVKKHGLTGARKVLADEKVSVSMPTLGTLAKDAGVELKRGRRKAA